MVKEIIAWKNWNEVARYASEHEDENFLDFLSTVSFNLIRSAEINFRDKELNSLLNSLSTIKKAIKDEKLRSWAGEYLDAVKTLRLSSSGKNVKSANFTIMASLALQTLRGIDQRKAANDENFPEIKPVRTAAD